MPRGKYPRTKENRKKIGEARRRYYDEHGRKIPVCQLDSPEAYREYMKLYQRQWRASHPHYYRDKRRLKTVKKEVTLEDIVGKFNVIQAHLIECKYRNEGIQSRRIEIVGN